MTIPSWMSASTVAAMRAAEKRARARGRDGAGEAWEVAWGHHPSMSPAAIAEATAAVLAASETTDGRGGDGSLGSVWSGASRT
jgi:hypothetical protein